ncbi:MAG: tetratricopeptide repeat protein [Elusimicrobia bacterium]|nr:tetratricopeptide repeat protein [Elusimicrobiota bacterium]
MRRTHIGLLLMLAGLLWGSVPISAAFPPSYDQEIRQGLYWIYHSQYDQARAVFSRISEQYPEDPAGDFFLSAADWWQLAEDLDRPSQQIEELLEEHCSRTIQKAQAAVEAATQAKTLAQAYFYLGGAYGLKGRWAVTQSQWFRAYRFGKRGVHFLRLALDYDPELSDAYLGLGIYDYYTDTLPRFQRVLARLFIRGDRQRGLEELHLVKERGRYATVEATLFLIEIYTEREHTPDRALPLAQQLRQEFPESPAMHFALMMALFHQKEWKGLREEANGYLRRIQSQAPYYTAKGMAPALYCLAMSFSQEQKDLDRAHTILTQIIETSPEPSRWVTFAYLRRGQIYDLQGKRDLAKDDYRDVLHREDVGEVHRYANQYLKRPNGWMDRD